MYNLNGEGIIQSSYINLELSRNLLLVSNTESISIGKIWLAIPRIRYTSGRVGLLYGGKSVPALLLCLDICPVIAEKQT